jgi:hypothetical protein
MPHRPLLSKTVYHVRYQCLMHHDLLRPFSPVEAVEELFNIRGMQCPAEWLQPRQISAHGRALVGRCSKPPAAEARAWVGISLGRTRRRGGGRSSGARARLVVKAAEGR